jgi:hypothetical protein
MLPDADVFQTTQKSDVQIIVKTIFIRRIIISLKMFQQSPVTDF